MKYNEHNSYFKWKVHKSPERFRWKPNICTFSMAVKNFKYHKGETYKATTFGVCYFFNVDFLWFRLSVDLRKKYGWGGPAYWTEVVPFEESYYTPTEKSK